MTKLEIRKIKSHFRLRWSAGRHNAKHPSAPVLFLDDKFVLRNVIAGKVLTDCMGTIYTGILPVTQDVNESVSNVVLINPVHLLYSTPDQIVHSILTHCANLSQPGRLIVNLNLFSVIYDRLNVSRQSLCQYFVDQIESQGFRLNDRLERFTDFTHGYGHLFLSFDHV